MRNQLQKDFILDFRIGDAVLRYSSDKITIERLFFNASRLAFLTFSVVVDLVSRGLRVNVARDLAAFIATEKSIFSKTFIVFRD